MSRTGKSVKDETDPLIVAASQFKVEPSVFLRALHIAPDAPPSAEARHSLERLRSALWSLRWVVPDDVLPEWFLKKLPLHTESPLEILEGENGFAEFLRLIESINRGDFA